MSGPAAPAKRLTISAADDIQVSGLLLQPASAKACLVLGHGAGAGMEHPYMAALARDLAAAGVATLRYQFPYMEKRGRRPDPPAVCHATVRAAVDAAQALVPSLPLLAGGKSFGGRMTSQTQAERPLPQVRGLVFFGFPLHPAKQPSASRGRHLFDVSIPMLFLQGTRDALAEPALVTDLVQQLGERATLQMFEHADHSFHVPSRSGRSDADINREMLQAFGAWSDSVTGKSA